MNAGYRKIRTSSGDYDFVVEGDVVTIIAPDGRITKTNKQELGSGIIVTGAEVRKFLISRGVIPNSSDVYTSIRRDLIEDWEGIRDEC